jgi:hypothetical protein
MLQSSRVALLDPSSFNVELTNINATEVGVAPGGLAIASYQGELFGLNLTNQTTWPLVTAGIDPDSIEASVDPLSAGPDGLMYARDRTYGDVWLLELEPSR